MYRYCEYFCSVYSILTYPLIVPVELQNLNNPIKAKVRSALLPYRAAAAAAAEENAAMYGRKFPKLVYQDQRNVLDLQ
jgi:hypothetical protein